MGAVRRALSRLFSFFRKPHLDAELDDEIAAHLEMAIEENLRLGLSPLEARRQALVRFGAMDLVKDVLPVLDDFERALKVETADRKYAKGVELIYQRLSETLKKLGLEPIEAAGRPFDPNLHQAVERVETDEAPDQTVLGEFVKGYNFKSKMLRPAMVKVAVKP